MLNSFNQTPVYMSYSPSFRKFLFLVITFSVYLFPKLGSGQGVLWGVTEKGGNGVGLIYRVNTDGSNQVVHQRLYYNYPGYRPQGKMTVAANGKLYGMTTKGGEEDLGVIFEFDRATGVYNKKFEFSSLGATGAAASGPLLQASNGKFYGFLSQGPLAGNYGVIFEFDATNNSFVKKYTFSGSANGLYPSSPLLASNGKLYGTTSLGGVDNGGVLFEYNLASSTFQKKIEFGSFGWKCVSANLIQAPNGFIYGTGLVLSTGIGFLFKYDPATNGITKVADGMSIDASIHQYNGKIYGIGSSAIFEFDLSTEIKTLRYTFPSNGIDGNEHQGLISASNGKLYGTAKTGGIGVSSSNLGYGVLYEFDLTTNVFTKKYDFYNDNSGMVKPTGTLVEAPDGILYGFVLDNILYEGGRIFSYSPASGTVTEKFMFANSSNGKHPQNRVTKAANGVFYCTSKFGGYYKGGTIVGFNPTLPQDHYQSFGVMGSFGPLEAAPSVGAHPEGGITLAPNGKMYGITSSGGTYGYGTIHETQPGTGVNTGNGSTSVKYHFPTQHSVEGSKCELTVSSNGKLYGMTSVGGANNLGTIYEYTTSPATVTTVFSFNGANGSTPYASLVESSSGKMYGMTYAGGTNGHGVIFEFNPATSTVIKLFDFNNASTGSAPRGNLIQASNGKLYGMTSAGGSNAQGVLFEFNLTTSTFTKRADFNSLTSGANPYGSLYQSPNGKLYGTAYTGGANNLGTLFEFDPATNTLTKKLDFNGTNGANPVGTFLYDSYTPLLEQVITFQAIPNKTYGDPAFNIIASSSSGLPLTLMVSSSPPDAVSISGNTITILKPGNVGVYANQAGNATYHPATQVVQGFTINPLTPVITITSPSSGIVGTSIPLTVNKGGSTGAVSYTVSPGTGSASITSSTLSPLSAGTVTITANVAGQGVYGPGTTTQVFTVLSKQNQTINFPPITPVARCAGSTFTLSGTATSGLPVTFTSSSNTIASISGNTVTVNAAGNFTITAGQVGNATFNAAPNVVQTFTGIAKPVATITPGGSTNFCQGSSITLTANPGDAGNTYLWSTGAATRTITVSTAGTFSVVVTNTTGCSSNSVSVTTTIKSTPAVYIAATYDLCTNGYTRLTATNVTGATSYSWSTGSTASFINIYSAGTRTVTVTFSNGCIRTASYTVGVCAPPPDPCDPPIEATAAKGTPCEEQIALKKEKELFLDQTSVYPNRANESMTISIPQPAKSELKVFVYSQFGQVVFSGKIPTNSDNLFIETRAMSNGMYMVHVEVPGGKKNEVVNRKVMIQH